MSQPKTLYVNEKWRAFSKQVKHRDDYRCLRCARRSSEVILQVHHQIYVAGKAPWEYAISDCLTLCKGCHAREHGLIEPDRGWTLLAIEDLGGLDGTCERNGCGADIRYEHSTYHPKWGYMVVGSTCIEYLTMEDRLISGNVIHLYKNVSKFVHDSIWDSGVTKKGSKFIVSSYNHHRLRIYGSPQMHSFQIVLKEKGIRWHKFGKIIAAKGKRTQAVKELAYVTLRGTMSDSKEEKYLLRNLYRQLKSST